MTEDAFISLGSNLAPEWHLPLAVRRVVGLGHIVAVSRVYQNPAVGRAAQPDYLNASVLVRTELPPLAIRETLRRIEADLGRVRGTDKFAPRTIDMDLCLYGRLVMQGELVLPAPEIEQRAYLAVTLAECAPEFVHPITGERLGVLAGRLRSGATLRVRPEIVLWPEGAA